MFTAELAECVRSDGEFFGVAAAFWEGEPAAAPRERRRVLEELRKGGDGARGHQVRRAAQIAPARLFAAHGVDRDIREAQVGTNRLQEAGALLERLHQVNGGFGPKDREHEAGVASAAPNIDDGFRRWHSCFRQAQQFERFGVMALDGLTGFNRGHAGVAGCRVDQFGMALKKRQPASRVVERWEEVRKVKPGEIQGTPRSAITLMMIQLRA